MESKLLEGDKDEWFYHSLERYRNLYMFELEFPVDAIEVINEVNFCLSGIQNYSKKCEILQLSIPPKLLPKDVEEGLCKDRDFTILSGGYASARILQIKPISAVQNLVATTQVGVHGVTLFQLGDDQHALIKEKCTLDLPECLGAGAIEGQGNHLIASGTAGKALYEWTMDSSGNFSLLAHPILKNLGRITKVKYWDDTTISFCTEKGTVALYDTRSDNSILEQTATKAGDQLLGIQYSFDTVPGKNLVGVVDSCGGYESYDVRKMESSVHCSRIFLPGCTNSDGVLSQKFNLQYDPKLGSEDSSNFIVTGMKEDCVQIYRDLGSEVAPLFTHDGHSKIVTHALWHPTSDRLILSCSIDAVLHAWQYELNNTCGESQISAGPVAEELVVPPLLDCSVNSTTLISGHSIE